MPPRRRTRSTGPRPQTQAEERRRRAVARSRIRAQEETRSRTVIGAAVPLVRRARRRVPRPPAPPPAAPPSPGHGDEGEPEGEVEEEKEPAPPPRPPAPVIEYLDPDLLLHNDDKSEAERRQFGREVGRARDFRVNRETLRWVVNLEAKFGIERIANPLTAEGRRLYRERLREGREQARRFRIGDAFDRGTARLPDPPPLPPAAVGVRGFRGVMKEPINYLARRDRRNNGWDPFLTHLTIFNSYITSLPRFLDHAYIEDPAADLGPEPEAAREARLGQLRPLRQQLSLPQFNIWKFCDRFYHQQHTSLNFWDCNRGLLSYYSRPGSLYYGDGNPGHPDEVPAGHPVVARQRMPFWDISDIWGLPKDPGLQPAATAAAPLQVGQYRRGLIYQPFIWNVSNHNPIFQNIRLPGGGGVRPPALAAAEGGIYFGDPQYGYKVKYNLVYRVFEHSINVWGNGQRCGRNVDFEWFYLMLHAAWHEYYHRVLDAPPGSRFFNWYNRGATAVAQRVRKIQEYRTRVQVTIDGRVADGATGEENPLYATGVINKSIRTKLSRLPQFWFFDLMLAVGKYLPSDVVFYPARITTRFTVEADGAVWERAARIADARIGTAEQKRQIKRKEYGQLRMRADGIAPDNLPDIPDVPLGDQQNDGDLALYGMPKRKREGDEEKKGKNKKAKTLQATRTRLKQAVKDPVIHIECDDYSCFVRGLIIDDLHQESYENGHADDCYAFQRLHHFLSEEGKEEFTVEAKELTEQLGLEWGKPVTDEDIKNAAVIRSKRIRLVDAHTLTLVLLTPYLDELGREVDDDCGLPDDNDKPHNRLCFFKDEKDEKLRHIGVIKRPGAFDQFARSFCTRCKKTIKNETHQCKKACPGCLYYECADFRQNEKSKAEGKKAKKIRCDVCFRLMQGEECMEQHKLNGSCAKWWECLECKPQFGVRKKLKRYHAETAPDGVMPAWEYDLVTGDGESDIPASARHEHNLPTCKHCGRAILDGEDHVCYIDRPKDIEDPVDPTRWFVADFEASTTTEDGHHEANALMIR